MDLKDENAKTWFNLINKLYIPSGVAVSTSEVSLLDKARTSYREIRGEDKEDEQIITSLSMISSMVSMDEELEKEPLADIQLFALLEEVVSGLGRIPSFAIGERHSDETDQVLQDTLVKWQSAKGASHFVFETSDLRVSAIRKDIASSSSAGLEGEAKVYLDRISKHGKAIKADMLRGVLATQKNVHLIGGKHTFKGKFGKFDLSNYELAANIVEVAQIVYRKIAENKKGSNIKKLTGVEDPSILDETKAKIFLTKAGLKPDDMLTFDQLQGPMMLSVGAKHPFGTKPIKEEAAESYDLMKKLKLDFTIVQEEVFRKVIKEATARDKDTYWQSFTYYRGAFGGNNYLIIKRKG